jgi:hypothetical protein
MSLLITLGDNLEIIISGLLAFAAFSLFLAACYLAFSRRNRAGLKLAGRYLLFAIAAAFLLKNFSLFKSRMIVDQIDGTKAIYIKRNVIWFDQRTKIHLRKDQDTGNYIWMAKDEGGSWYPFFVEL